MLGIRCVAAFSLLALSAALARADGMIYQLPKDGQWASYDFDASVRKADGAEMNIKGTLRLASVGQLTVKKQPCRWIEIQLDTKMTVAEHKVERNETYKLLIPEKFLAKGEAPLEHVVQAWARRGKSEPQKIDKPNDIDAGPLPIILSAPWKNLKQLERATVESKLGKLACKGSEGTLEFKMREGAMKCKIENRLHADSPFGVVTSHWTLTPPEGAPIKMGPMDWYFKLVGLGENAKSKMPDAK